MQSGGVCHLFYTLWSELRKVLVCDKCAFLGNALIL